MLQILKKILDFFLDTKWDTEQYQILSQIPKSFADTKSSISDTKMATLVEVGEDTSYDTVSNLLFWSCLAKKNNVKIIQ